MPYFVRDITDCMLYKLPEYLFTKS